jgi:hypothetical protein
MKIDTATLVAVSQDFFTRYDACQDRMIRMDLAFEAVGMLRAFVRGYEEEEQRDMRHYEEAAHIPDEEEDNPF